MLWMFKSWLLSLMLVNLQFEFDDVGTCMAILSFILKMIYSLCSSYLPSLCINGLKGIVSIFTCLISQTLLSSSCMENKYF